MVNLLVHASRTSKRSCVLLAMMPMVTVVSLICTSHFPFPHHFPLSSLSSLIHATANKKPTAAKSRKRKQLASPADSSPMSLAGSSPPINSDDETNAPAKKKSKARGTKSKKAIATTPETEEDICNAKAIAAGRARYTADKLAAEIKKEANDDDDGAWVDEAEPLGMNIDEGEDEGLTAYQLVKNEVLGEGVEV